MLVPGIDASAPYDKEALVHYTDDGRSNPYMATDNEIRTGLDNFLTNGRHYGYGKLLDKIQQHLLEKLSTNTTYGSEAANNLPSGLYLGLFHGRVTPDEELNDWGLQGPVLGPILSASIGKGESVSVTDMDGNLIQIPFVEDLLAYNGRYYGDRAFFNPKQPVSFKPTHPDLLPMICEYLDGHIPEIGTPLPDAIYALLDNDATKILIGPGSYVQMTYSSHVRFTCERNSNPIDLVFNEETKKSVPPFNHIEIFSTFYKPEPVIQLIIDRKLSGIDCTEAESTELKGWLRDNFTKLHFTSTIQQIQKLFPLEISEFLNEPTHS